MHDCQLTIPRLIIRRDGLDTRRGPGRHRQLPAKATGTCKCTAHMIAVFVGHQNGIDISGILVHPDALGGASFARPEPGID
jgi:hypothetical protein